MHVLCSAVTHLLLLLVHLLLADTLFGADLTIMEEGTELLHRLQVSGDGVLLCSLCHEGLCCCHQQLTLVVTGGSCCDRWMHILQHISCSRQQHSCMHPFAPLSPCADSAAH